MNNMLSIVTLGTVVTCFLWGVNTPSFFTKYTSLTEINENLHKYIRHNQKGAVLLLASSVLNIVWVFSSLKK